VRTSLLLVLLFIGLGLLLTRCPANRDGMPGQLAQAMEETTAAAHTGETALTMLIDRRSTVQLTSVALSDSRTEIVNAYKGIAELRAEDPVDVARQRMLTVSMTTIIGQLNAASATVRDVSRTPAAEQLRDDLRASADELKAGYR
jgi:hypothetical protein